MAGQPAHLRGERRWPMALAVLVAAGLHVLLPEQLRVQGAGWLLWVVIGILVVIILGDPGRIDKVDGWIRVVTGVLFGLITLANAYAAVQLVLGILDNASFTQPEELLISGAIVWLTNVITFALWFWDLDRGGAAARASGSGRSPALVFPEMTHAEHVPPNWLPKFVDYLAFSFSTATAFSPTDVSAVKPWAKAMVVAESLLSLALAALVIARAVNVLQ
ncbi:MAG: hypothetical protein PSX37_05725 [bacterium]|nr:hypothetical protein [bacterium]